MKEMIHILIAEDSPSDAKLAQYEIKKYLRDVVFEVVDGQADFIKALDEFKPVLVVSDYTMPSFTGLEALKITLEKAPFTPLIIYTGSINEDTAVACMKAGAVDYVLKENIKRLGPAVVHALEHRQARVDSFQNRQALIESEQRFRLLAENANDLIYRYELLPERRYLYVSPSATEMTGYTPDEHYADPDLGLKIVYPEDKPILQTLIENDGSFNKPIVLRWIKKDGSIIWTEQKNTPIYENGKLKAIQGIARDITARKLAEDELRESEELHQKLVENVPDLIIRTDLEGNIEFLNEQALKHYTNTKADYFLGRNMLSFVSDEDRPRAMQNTRLMLEQALGPQRYKFIIDGGEIHECEINGDVLRQANNLPMGMVFVLRDITETMKAARMIKESEMKYRSLITQMQLGLALLSFDEIDQESEFKVVEVNPSLEQLTGLTRESVIGKTINQILPDSGNEVIGHLEALKYNSRSVTFEIYVQELERYFRVIAYEQQHEQIALLVENISQQKKAELELKQRLDELQKWHEITLGREDRLLELKNEVNQLLVKLGQEIRYPSAEEIAGGDK